MAGFGVYIHVPFCTRRCDYCDFATWTDRHQLMTAYAGACVTDLTRRYDSAPPPPATSVFFGGGTPSLLPAELLLSILDAVPRRAGAEVTVECNPDTVTDELLTAYRVGGVTRLSFGVQSMEAHVLAALGRTHDPAGVEAAVAAARAAGFENFNLDVIYGAAGETQAGWQRTLEAVLSLDPPHVSAYALTVEPGTPLAHRIDAGAVSGPDDDDQAEKYLAADAVLTGAGRPWYEISNWARPGAQCRQNLLYWTQGEYLGIGCAAHGHTPAGRRWWNVRTPDRYIDLIGQGKSAEGAHEILGDAEREAEAALLGLRTSGGVPDSPAAATLVADGLARHQGDRIVLTIRGRLLANEATTRLLGPVQGAEQALEHADGPTGP